MWGDLHTLLGALPCSEPIVVVGDFNAHLGGHIGVQRLPCPCGHCTRQCLTGSTCSRGEKLFHMVQDWGWTMCNGCTTLPTHTFTRGETRSSLDYILLSAAAVPLYTSCHATEPLLGRTGDSDLLVRETHTRLIASFTITVSATSPACSRSRPRLRIL